MIFNTDNFINNATRVQYVKYMLNLLSVFFNEKLYVWLPPNQAHRITWMDAIPTEIEFEWLGDEDEKMLVTIHSYNAELMVGEHGSTLAALKRFIYTQPRAIALGLLVDFKIVREIHDPYEIALQLLEGDLLDMDLDNDYEQILISSNSQAPEASDVTQEDYAELLLGKKGME